ncbi:hypothetical protein VNI00_012080 [Paramarasmius palmivorus]|uniref:Uncharacterized protein n=1 Tax=Paramarasmius palmivorus TaxID=297713 RepID=A0AAW0CAC0_9AGAR
MSPRRSNGNSTTKAKAAVLGVKEPGLVYPAVKTSASGVSEVSKDEERDARFADFGATAQSLKDKAKITMLERRLKEMEEQLKEKDARIAALQGQVSELETTANQQIRYVNQLHADMEASQMESMGMRQTMEQVDGRWKEVVGDNVQLLIENVAMKVEISRLTRQFHDQEMDLNELLLRAGRGNMARAVHTIRFGIGHIHFVLSEAVRKFRSSSKLQLVRTMQSLVRQVENAHTTVNRIAMLSWSLFPFTPALEQRLIDTLGAFRDDIPAIETQIDLQGEYAAFHAINASMDLE